MIAVLSTFAAAVAGCASSSQDEVPGNVREAVEGTWRTPSGSSFVVTVGERNKDCSGGVGAWCDWLDSGALDIAAQSSSCGNMHLFGSVTWNGGGKLGVTFRNTLDYKVDGEVVDDAMSLRDVSPEHGVKALDATCLWNELGSTTTLTRSR